MGSNNYYTTNYHTACETFLRTRKDQVYHLELMCEVSKPVTQNSRCFTHAVSVAMWIAPLYERSERQGYNLPLNMYSASVKESLGAKIPLGRQGCEESVYGGVVV